ncbi:LysR family transcriptional regulator [Paenibacillus cymbidii]|uniref:LysR family transcriptional regulator n=1 Tax=Paenibacillus cymbidii TaxID=1639034 RepID=UPI00108072AE|nr:LysR family transcriptional regulator [Paenibacillus cymbidii]
MANAKTNPTNLETYRVFLHTARCGNLTRAAQELHLTQPSVSYAIKQLEETFGVKLFHRLPKGVELTEEGKALHGYVELSFAALETASKHLHNLKQLNEGELRIGASDSLIKQLLLPQLNAFHREYPGIRIRLSHGKTPELAQRLREGAIDCAVVHMPLDDAQLDVLPIAEWATCVVVGEAYRELAQQPQPLTAGALAALPLILLSPGSSTRQFIEAWFAAKGVAVKPDIELGSVDLLLEFARTGYGAAFVSRVFTEEELRSGKLFELALRDPLPPQTIGLAVRQGRSLSAAAQQFVQLFRHL